MSGDPWGDAPPTPPVNRLALVSVVVGALWLGGLGSAVALALAAVAKRQIAESEGAQSGDGYANAAMVLGMVGLVVLLLLFLWWLRTIAGADLRRS